jgi:diaminopimelate epimerase
MISFSKYQGTGNDFVMIDNRNQKFEVSQQLIENLCHRRFGIGADGLILIENAEGYDFRMVYFNADGNEGSMCGNGGRCAVKFAHDLGFFEQNTKFIAVDGEHLASIDNDMVSLKMIDVNTIESGENFDFMNTGSPHYVTFVENLSNYDVFNEGKNIRYSDYWVSRGGTNVNFVEVLNENSISVRTYERGVEDETYSCGTGVTACAIDSYLQKGIKAPLNIQTLGGTLAVDFKVIDKHNFTDIYLIGPSKKVFNGFI